MHGRQPISTRADTLFPSTTLFRSRLSRPGLRVRCLAAQGRCGSHPLFRAVVFGAEGACTYPAHARSQDRPVVEWQWRSEEHTSELQSLMRISYAVFCLTKTQHTHIKLTHRMSPYKNNKPTLD